LVGGKPDRDSSRFSSGDPDPQSRTDEESAGVANMLAGCLRRAAERRD
jgi:hypothetical protein